MVRLRWTVLACWLILTAAWPAPRARAARVAAWPAAAACPTTVVMLGADLTAAQRAEVVKRLGAPPAASAAYLTESLAGETAQAGGLIPPELLGTVAISSARLKRLPAHGGLTVRTDRSITLDSAALYANALLTAGLHDAQVQVTAPLAAPALGTTALLGLLRGAQEACISLSAERARLAVRELVFTTHVADAYGAAAAADLMARAKHAALASPMTDGAALAARVDQAITAAQTPLRAVTRASLIGFLTDLTRASSRSPDLRSAPLVRVTSSFLATAAGSAGPAPTPAAGHTLSGVAIITGHGTLTGTFGGVTRTFGHLVNGLVVTRNGQPARLQDIRPGDTVTMTTNPRGLMIGLDARGRSITPAPTPAAASPPVDRGVVTGEGSEAITYTVTGVPTARSVVAGPGLVVTRNGRHATLAGLRRGDTVTVHRNAQGRPDRVDALSPPVGPSPTPSPEAVTGVVSSVAGATLSFTETASGVPRAVSASSFTRVRRDGQPASLAAIRAGDRVTVTLDGQGTARAVEARSGPAPFKAPSITQQAWPFTLLAFLVGGGLLLLVLRYLPIFARPLPFAIVERRAGSAADAAAPATCELTRRARILCPDGEEGRLMHVVVLPRTGALLRLIVRDRTDVLREVPAHVIASTSPSVIRLILSWPDLQDVLKDRPAFSARRYKRLPVDRRRPADDAPLLQASADSLRIEIGGMPRL